MAKKIPNPIDSHAGARVRMRRMMVNMSQSDLGNRVGITFQQIQKYEKGTNRMGSSRLQQFAEIMGVPVGFFFEGAPSHGLTKPGGSAPDITGQFMSSRGGLLLAQSFLKIKSHKVRHKLVELAMELALAKS